MYRTFLPWYMDQNADSVCIKEHKNHQLQEDSITLLNWNVHKNNHHYKWLHDFANILHKYNPNLISFQEYQTMSRRSILDKDEDFGYGFFPNIAYKQQMYGLLTASKSKMYNFHSLFSHDVEPIIKTPKVSFVSQHRMYNGESLTVINVHMINFVKINKYIAQLKQIEDVCLKDEGALILTGDFNTWSQKRMRLLRHMTEAAGLDIVTFEKEYHKKSFMAHPLDHIFYRGLIQRDSKILKEIKTSDHKPIMVTFSQ